MFFNICFTGYIHSHKFTPKVEGMTEVEVLKNLKLDNMYDKVYFGCYLIEKAVEENLYFEGYINLDELINLYESEFNDKLLFFHFHSVVKKENHIMIDIVVHTQELNIFYNSFNRYKEKIKSSFLYNEIPKPEITKIYNQSNFIVSIDSNSDIREKLEKLVLESSLNGDVTIDWIRPQPEFEGSNVEEIINFVINTTKNIDFSSVFEILEKMAIQQGLNIVLSKIFNKAKSESNNIIKYREQIFTIYKIKGELAQDNPPITYCYDSTVYNFIEILNRKPFNYYRVEVNNKTKIPKFSVYKA